MHRHTSPTNQPRLPFAPENIYPREDGTFVWFDGQQYIDVSHEPIWWRCPHGLEWQESLASRLGRDGGAPCCVADTSEPR